MNQSRLQVWGFSLLFLLIALSGYSYAAQTQPSPSPNSGGWTFDRVENNVIHFTPPPGVPTPKPIRTSLFDINYLGVLQSDEGGVPYFLFSAKNCQDCKEDPSIYSIRPTGEKPTSFVYPGKVFDPKNRALLFESRAFYGKCLPRKGDVYVVFQKERVDRRRGLQPSVFVAEAAKDYLQEALIERRMPNVTTTLRFVKQKACREISGRNRLMLSKPLDLHPRANIESDDDEDEVEKKTPEIINNSAT